MKIKSPCGHRVTVKLKRVEERSEAGIILSTGKDLKRQQYGVEEGYVVQLGMNAFKGFDGGEPWCAVGDLVGIVQYSGVHYEEGDDVYRVVNDVDVMCILEE